MNKFLNNLAGKKNTGPEKKQVDVIVTATITKEKTEQYIKGINAIVKNTTEDDVILLGKLCENSIMRNMALSYLRNNIK